jgi:magnesium-transporting ATPase (P-type)
MRRPPRRPGAPSWAGFPLAHRLRLVLIGGATIAVFLIERRLDMPLELARTLAVNTLVFGQVFYLFNSRYLRESSLSLRRLFANRIAWVAVGVLALLQLIFVYVPVMQHWFGSAGLALRHWLIPLAIGGAAFLLIEIEKTITRRFFLPPPAQAATDGPDPASTEQPEL